jgi:hypothetical protein
MGESPRNNFEIAQESIESVPSAEQIKEVFNEFFEGKEHQDLRKLEDEKGIYLWEVKVQIDGGDAEYSYVRQGVYPEVQTTETTIYVTFFDKDGIPEGGHDVAKFVNGKWIKT